jgi:hypothetical protein
MAVYAINGCEEDREECKHYVDHNYTVEGTGLLEEIAKEIKEQNECHRLR